MECAACAGSIEKAVKRLPGIEEATVAVLQNRAQVVYRPAFVQVCLIFSHSLRFESIFTLFFVKDTVLLELKCKFH